MEYGLVLGWLALYLALGAAGVPIAAALCPRLADRGATVALPVALAVVALVAYWFGHLSLWLGLGAGFVALVGSATVLISRGIEGDWGAYAEAAAVFAVAFLLLVAIRAVDPSVTPTGGEKFLDFGLLKSLLRATRLPPEDMWFAGEPVKYYYGGHLIASLLARLARTDARFAYNLALAGFFGMLVTAAYGLAGAIAADHGRSRRLAGALGAFFAGVASNLSTAGRVVLWLLPEPVARAIVGSTGIPADQVSWTPADFFYWDASRVIDGTINEFPLFAWLNGDLHAHMMSTPFLLLTATLLYSYFLTPAGERRHRRLLVLGAVPALAAVLAFVNTWSFPTVAGLTGLALVFAPAEASTLLPGPLADRFEPAGGWIRRELTGIGSAAVIVGGLVAVGVLLSLPFWLGTASGRSIGFFPDRSGMGELLLVHGGFVLAFVPYLLVRFRGTGEQFTQASVVVVALALPAAWLNGFAAFALFGPILAGSWILLRWRRDVGFETVLVVAGTGILLLVELAYVKEQAGPGRLNTVFKTYMQIWVLWAPAAGVVLARLVRDVPPSLARSTAERWTRATTLLAVVLVVSTSLYGAFALSSHFDRGSAVASVDDPTLDALAFVGVAHPDEAPAIRWLDALEGQPNIVSAPSTRRYMYRWNDHGGNAPSSLTGVPTLAGWAHEIGYRGTDAYRQRVDHVRAIYEGPSARRADLLALYDVEYVYVGPAERNRYDITIEESDGIRVAREWEAVTIYEVDGDAIAGDA